MSTFKPTLTISNLKKHWPEVSLIAGDRFQWSPKNKTITYPTTKIKDNPFWWRLFHEYGHADLDHASYNTDMELLKMELEAWEKAKVIMDSWGISVSQDYIEDCMDTYRDWLHKRSTCPTCGSHGIMNEERVYNCPNCSSNWTVPRSQLCAVQRRLTS